MQPPDSEPAIEPGFSLRACRLLTGLDVGFAGAMAMLLWLVIHSRLAGEWWWAKMNIAGGLFYGSGVYSMGPGRATLAGGALLLVIYAIAGLVFAQIAPLSGHARNALLAVCYSGCCNVVADKWVWPRLDPFAPAFFPFPVMLAGHLLFALALTRFPGRFRSLAATFGNPSWTKGFLQEKRASGSETAGPDPVQPTQPASSSTTDIVESEADRLE